MTLYKASRTWRSQGLRKCDGIIVGSDITQEWLLPWWLENTLRHNRRPIAFVDFGLSEEKKQWCRERGELIPLLVADIFVKEREELAFPIIEEWENRYGENFWDSRKAWFKKPLACLQSPFRRTIWVDLDCEVLGSLDFVFDACMHPSGIAMVKDRSSRPSSFPMYNSGVIAFQREIPLIKEWADQSFERNGEFRGDQELLSRMIFEKKLSISELPFIYNWNVGYGIHPDTVVCHWVGEMGKLALRNQIILNQLL